MLVTISDGTDRAGRLQVGKARGGGPGRLQGDSVQDTQFRDPRPAHARSVRRLRLVGAARQGA